MLPRVERSRKVAELSGWRVSNHEIDLATSSSSLETSFWVVLVVVTSTADDVLLLVLSLKTYSDMSYFRPQMQKRIEPKNNNFILGKDYKC